MYMVEYWVCTWWSSSGYVHGGVVGMYMVEYWVCTCWSTRYVYVHGGVLGMYMVEYWVYMYMVGYVYIW